ncbi:NADPH2:quinone reductase [Sediminihabitans luteus]|uniref:NADPH2:quinone reductase n=1 Tax=Sediminihabitans luteus TaxID=1138585 RepID=A0A2M9CCS5_9CELL|nr:quinone oxidoreductase [Sediminihabitans luteus]PJJ69126.1 NADPH2:quinone reductase [Sediminihabitans luteus]GII99512.1 quinone oxidoreductase [Sediminihabitans luteus]
MHAIVAREPGGPEVLELTDVPGPYPGPRQLLVRVDAAGVNFVDTYRRSGVYPGEFPHIVGVEGAGEVLAVGDDVAEFSRGDRVLWTDAPGSYAERVAVDATSAVRVPDGVPTEVAAAVGLQGLTAHYLVTSSYAVAAGDDVLVHAGAGGVGLLLTQMAATRGARVITTVSTREKEALSRAGGASDVVRYTELDDLTTELPALVRDLTEGRGVAAVYDSVGRSTFDASLASLRPRGTLVLFGGSSGQVPPVDLQRLNRAGSVFVTRPTLADHVATRAELLWRAREVLGAVADGSLSVRLGATYPLAQAAEAHRALEARETTGKVVLVP